MSAKHKHEPAAPAAEPKSRGGMLRVVGVIVFILMVIAGETLAAYFWLPSASEVATVLKAKPRAKAEGGEEEEPDAKDETPTVEVDLGTYSISSHQPAANTTLRIDFKIVGAIEAADKPAFEELVENNKNRLRDRIIFEVRGAEVNDLTDPGLGLIKRRILERVNALLGKPILRSVVFSDFSFAGA